MVRPEGIEPPLLVPKTRALSIKLRAHFAKPRFFRAGLILLYFRFLLQSFQTTKSGPATKIEE